MLRSFPFHTTPRSYIDSSIPQSPQFVCIQVVPKVHNSVSLIVSTLPFFSSLPTVHSNHIPVPIEFMTKYWTNSPFHFFKNPDVAFSYFWSYHSCNHFTTAQEEQVVTPIYALAQCRRYLFYHQQPLLLLHEPMVLLIHNFTEFSFSWKHQMVEMTRLSYPCGGSSHERIDGINDIIVETVTVVSGRVMFVGLFLFSCWVFFVDGKEKVKERGIGICVVGGGSSPFIAWKGNGVR